MPSDGISLLRTMSASNGAIGRCYWADRGLEKSEREALKDRNTFDSAVRKALESRLETRKSKRSDEQPGK